MSYRGNVSADGTPVQQSMTQDPHDYRAQNLDRLMLGVVLSVYPADDEDGNRTAIQTLERRGHTHECTVLILNDGTSTYMQLPNVVITPNAPSGIDDYEERLPRGSSCLTTGEELNSSMHQINPYDLDGDWCVVGYIGGQIDRPFVIRWWPHARNTFDPATSGRGSPDADGVGRALTQVGDDLDRPQGRYLRRINGVETVITSSGDIILSTTFAGGQIQPGGDPTRGRFSRTEVDNGGDVRIYMKPSSTIEWTWDPQPDGVGVLDSAEPELPQPNPAGGVRAGDKNSTYMTVNQERWRAQVPTEFEVFSKDAVYLSADNTMELLTDNLSASGETAVAIESTAGTVEMTAATMLDLTAAIMNLTATGALTLSAGGGLVLGGSSVSVGPAAAGGVPAGPGAIVAEAGSITLGEGGTDALIKGTELSTAWTATSAVLAAVPNASDLASAIALANANKVAILDMITALSAALSATSKTL